MEIGIEPTVDYAFKRVFGREHNEHLLLALLNAILQHPEGRRLVSVEILNPFLPHDTADDKLAVLDVKARDQLGRLFNIEMQVRTHEFLRARVLYYWARLYAEQLQAGDDYEGLQPTISVLILDDVFSPEETGAHRRFRLWDDECGTLFTDHLELHVLELPKFHKVLSELTNDLDRWLYFLCHAATLDLGAWPNQLADPTIHRAAEELSMLSQTALEREHYESRRKGQLDYRSELKAARRDGAAKGRVEGRTEGELIGQIRLLQALLQQPQPARDELAAYSETHLRTMLAELIQQARQAGLPIGAPSAE